MQKTSAVVHTAIPFRLDRLPWSRFHLLVVIGLGITWILDGLEVTIVGSLGPSLQSAETLHLSSSNIGAVASFYVIGAVSGALGFGWLTDRFGRRFVFYVTLIVYLAGVLLSAFAWDFWSFAFFRMITGLGIGGEYAAVNSAIDELIPAKYRGRIDLIVNGSFWLGAAAGALASPFLLDQNLFPANIGWRLGFGIGGTLGLSILMLRRFVPESPRWLVTHCRSEEAEATVEQIEAHVAKSAGRDLPQVNETHGSSEEGIRHWTDPYVHAWPIPPTQYFSARAHGRAVFSVQLSILHIRLDTRSFLQGSERAGRVLPVRFGDRQFLRSAVAGNAL
jgi:MFS family permease